MRRDASLFGSWNILWTTLNDLGAVAAPRLTTNLASNLVKMHFVSFWYFDLFLDSLRFALISIVCRGLICCAPVSQHSSVVVAAVVKCFMCCAELSCSCGQRWAELKWRWSRDGVIIDTTRHTDTQSETATPTRSPGPTWPIDSAATVCLPPSPLPVYVKPTPVLLAQIENDYEKINCNFLNCFFFFFFDNL